VGSFRQKIEARGAENGDGEALEALLRESLASF
jgi:hypothetical protein